VAEGLTIAEIRDRRDSPREKVNAFSEEHDPDASNVTHPRWHFCERSELPNRYVGITANTVEVSKDTRPPRC
jgi:hypothetical protein